MYPSTFTRWQSRVWCMNGSKPLRFSYSRPWIPLHILLSVKGKITFTLISNLSISKIWKLVNGARMKSSMQSWFSYKYYSSGTNDLSLNWCWKLIFVTRWSTEVVLKGLLNSKNFSSCKVSLRLPKSGVKSPWAHSWVDVNVNVSLRTPSTTLKAVLSLSTSFGGAFGSNETSDEVPETEERNKDLIKTLWTASYPAAVSISASDRTATFIRVKEEGGRCGG